jgi:hypothetical protein
MAYPSAELAADLSALLAIGRVDLPQIAFIYTTLNNDVAGNADNDMAAFDTGYAPRGSAGDLSGEVYSAWSELRNLLQDTLGYAAQGASTAGAAIVSIVDAYAATNTAAAVSLRSVWANGIPPGLSVDQDEPLPAVLPTVKLSS